MDSFITNKSTPAPMDKKTNTKSFYRSASFIQDLAHGIKLTFCYNDSNQPRPNYATKSKYEGSADILGYQGEGRYIYPHGVIYEGYFKDGDFHGQGTLIYPMGQKLHGVWNEGELVNWTYEFKDGLEFTDDFKYCQYPDRRFMISIKEGLLPAPEERLTNEEDARKLPRNCYDVGDGYFHKKNQYVQSASAKAKITRIPNPAEAFWILKNCRTTAEELEPVGYRPDLYPAWTAGTSESTEDLIAQYVLSEKAKRKVDIYNLL